MVTCTYIHICNDDRRGIRDKPVARSLLTNLLSTHTLRHIQFESFYKFIKFRYIQKKHTQNSDKHFPPSPESPPPPVSLVAVALKLIVKIKN